VTQPAGRQAAEPAGWDICLRCRHPRPLHSNGQSACKARGCHSGPDGEPCQGFMSEVSGEAPEDVPAVSSALSFEFRPPAAAAG
jgi:hypothetical protein